MFSFTLKFYRCIFFSGQHRKWCNACSLPTTPLVLINIWYKVSSLDLKVWTTALIKNKRWRDALLDLFDSSVFLNGVMILSSFLQYQNVFAPLIKLEADYDKVSFLSFVRLCLLLTYSILFMLSSLQLMYLMLLITRRWWKNHKVRIISQCGGILD